MRAIIQRVSNANVMVENKILHEIKTGIVVLLGIEANDSADDIEWLSAKIINLRIFNDVNSLMNISLKEVNGDMLLISQFTLFASTKKGNRPSFIDAASPEIALPIYHKMITAFENELGKKIYTGIFGADMKVNICNDGPVTITIDSKNKT